MEKVTGIGGFFFRAENPQELTDWYVKHLGITKVPMSYEDETWSQIGGPTTVHAFDKSDGFLGKHNMPWVINFRVNDLNAMVKQLRSAGIKVESDPTIYPNGRFAYLADLENNPIQLWEMSNPH